MQTLDLLWYSRSPHPSPLGLAAQLGWFIDEFRDDGIGVFTLQDSADPGLRASHLDHHVPHSIRQGGNVPALWARGRGAKTRVIGLSWLDEFQGVLSLPGRGVDTPADLRGRRLALPVYESPVDSRRAEALHGHLHTLQLAGLGPDEVSFVDVPADAQWMTVPGQLRPHGLFGEYARQMGALLRQGVDAVYVKGARGLQAARTAQAQVVTDLRRHPDPAAHVHTGTPRPITADQALLDEHPEIVARFLSRVLAAGPWAAAHPAETRAYLARQTRSHEELITEAYGAEVHLQLGTDLAPRSIRALDAHKRFLLDWGFLSQDFDIQNWIDPAPLAAARQMAELAAAQEPVL